MKKTGNKHLVQPQRNRIEFLLNEQSKLVAIAHELSRDPRGISYEIKAHRIYFVRSNAHNKCGIQNSCKKTRLCNTCSSGKCSFCTYMKCNNLCPDFTAEPICKSLQRFPYVCNGCDTIKSCRLPKYLYKANEAHNEYKTNIRSWKLENYKLNEKEFQYLDTLISKNVKNGIAPDVIQQVYNLRISTTTIYSYIERGLLSISNIDLKRKVSYKIRANSKPKPTPINYAYLENRRFQDYQTFILDHPAANIWQMDCVEGKKGVGEASVLSLLYTKTNLQLYFKISSVSQDEIVRVFEGIKKHLTAQVFKEVFECLLTDNGTEFRDPLRIELDATTGEQLISIFYCEARRSDQKGKYEKNHEYFRECIPKGVSMTKISNHQMNKASNAVNNYPRKLFKYKTPLSLSMEFLNHKVFELNNLTLMDVNKVTLKPLKIQ